jgi:hypothetical protein
VVSSLVLAGAFIAYLVSESTSVPAGQFRVPRQARAASQSAAPAAQSYPQGSTVPWYQNPDVVTAVAMGGAAIAVHEAAKHHREHVAERRAADRQRQAAVRAHGGQLQNQNWQRQDNAAAGLGYRTTDQIGLGALLPRQQHAVPGRHTPHSDIYGNLV